MLRNWFCYVREHQYKLVVYVVDDHDADVVNHLTYLAGLYGNITVVAYPHALFWSVVARKKAPMVDDGHRSANYLGNRPSFGTFVLCCM